MEEQVSEFVRSRLGTILDMPKKRTQTNVGTADLDILKQTFSLLPANKLKPEMQNPVFVCIDCEAYEHAQHKITEIGVAVLDSLDVAGLDASQGKEAWFAKMKCAHYRPIEYASLRNKKYIRGCPDSFNFGPSTWIHLKDASKILRRIFAFPTRLQDAGQFDNVQSQDGYRNVVFVGHDANSDSKFLKQVGFSLTTDAKIVRIMDTQHVCGGSKKNQIGLRSLLLSLGIEPVNLHNAGNDAVYTLQALIAMALKDHSSPGSVIQDLRKDGKKLPPAKYDSIIAPQIWAGTAVKQSGANLNIRHGYTAKRICLSRNRRTERKCEKIIGALHAVNGAVVSGPSQIQLQPPLPNAPTSTFPR
ncbi:hypothetical protein M433DRAFT_130585 [Acidomyces richmondensis BFW]|nr:MAG: hypothetical protein FE78DRAFT_29381 [Acidomyces sp. 'richmondensis']KYG50246.1 hypothetical protein M433DRAFT_130585 [Acidomyces richmondensis BFW]